MSTNHVAKLIDHNYAHVATIPILDVKRYSDLPGAVLWKGRVFTYYVHTVTSDSALETEHPYREVFNLLRADELVKP